MASSWVLGGMVIRAGLLSLVGTRISTRFMHPFAPPWQEKNARPALFFSCAASPFRGKQKAHATPEATL
jgi:hypothetical protein